MSLVDFRVGLGAQVGQFVSWPWPGAWLGVGFRSPLVLLRDDVCTVDTRDGTLYKVVRGNAVIWERGIRE